LRIPAQMQRVCAPSPCKPELRSNTRCPESLVGCAFAVARPPRCSLLPFAACVLVLLSCPPAQWVCVCLQPPSLLSRRMALHTAAPMGADTAGKSGVAKADQHHTASRLGRCQKQTGPALFAPGNSRAAYSPPQAAWLTPLVPARPPTASAWHRPSTPFQASLVQANRSGQFSGERRGLFSKGHCAHRAHLPLAPSLFVFFSLGIEPMPGIEPTVIQYSVMK
jgi:hypothetical protein